ncbi:hypothetical protein MMAGJ_00030 [Mycolicibacterium mageritense]|uniref:Acyl-CoA carboxylase subunit epsilon n=2 Tax=Mycolicibacterium mageritense TaxID=53462 RepID=A0ABM7HJT4_MYCME|nr:hypothetical protein MMAGJ_00030 [Mycolicibacterium mageritense]
MRKKRAEHAAATAVTDPVDIVDAAPETSPETEHTEAVQRLTDYLTAIREQETAAHAEQVAAAMEAVSSVPNLHGDYRPRTDRRSHHRGRRLHRPPGT